MLRRNHIRNHWTHAYLEIPALFSLTMQHGQLQKTKLVLFQIKTKHKSKQQMMTMTQP